QRGAVPARARPDGAGADHRGRLLPAVPRRPTPGRPAVAVGGRPAPRVAPSVGDSLRESRRSRSERPTLPPAGKTLPRRWESLPGGPDRKGRRGRRSPPGTPFAIPFSRRREAASGLYPRQSTGTVERSGQMKRKIIVPGLALAACLAGLAPRASASNEGAG